MKINYNNFDCENCYYINEALIGAEEIKDKSEILFCQECETDLDLFDTMKNDNKVKNKLLKKALNK